MKIRLDSLRQMIREALIASLGSAQGKRAAGLAAPSPKVDAPLFNDPQTLADEATTGYDSVLYDTLRKMLDEDPNLDPAFADFVQKALDAYDVVMIPGRGTGTRAGDDLLWEELITLTVKGLYNPSQRGPALRLFRDVMTGKYVGKYDPAGGREGDDPAALDAFLARMPSKRR